MSSIFKIIKKKLFSIKYCRLHINISPVDNLMSPKKTSAQAPSHTMPPSFLTPDVLKHLCRELDRDKIEAEFSSKVNADFKLAIKLYRCICKHTKIRQLNLYTHA